ncbi:MAG: DUF2066 domain-containing protein [Lysobacterales bacterium]|jgi:hypothetical protein
MRSILLVTLLFFSLTPAVGLGVEVTGLYTGEAKVENKGAQERSRALPLALEQVLGKLSGLRQFDDYPGLDSVLDQASSAVLSYYYRNVGKALADGSQSEQLRLVARFSDPQVEEFARSLALPLWQTERPALDMWLVIDDGAGRRIMPLEYAYVRDGLQEIADARGLPLWWPKPDDEGQYRADMQLLWGGYTEDIAAGDGSGVMIIAARREGLEWSVRINLSYGGQNWAWRMNGLDLQSALDQGMQEAIDRIAAANTIAASDMGTWTQEVTVAGITNPDTYARVLAYLQGLGVVSKVAVGSALPSRVTFRVTLNAMPRYLRDAIASGQLLVATEDGNYRVAGTDPDGF